MLKQVQLPGASKYQTGLAIDMSVPEGQEDELAGKIDQLAPQYGFVLRYPDGKSAITGVDFENWHYRYVGVENPSICRSTIWFWKNTSPCSRKQENK